jgi:hypothetical protein
MSIDDVTGQARSCMSPHQPLDLYHGGQTADAHWVVKRDTAVRKTPDEPRTIDAKEQTRQREWGGEVAVKTYCTAAAAQMLLKHLGRDLSVFLAVADCADLGQVMAHLHAASLVQANAAPTKRGDGEPVDEPPLPFVN